MSDRLLVDTNVLVYAVDSSAPQHAAAKSLYDKALVGDIELCITTQLLLEYVSVVTNPKRTRNPISVDEAWGDVDDFRALLPLIAPDADHLERVVELARTLQIGRTDVFDLSTAATMIGAGVDTVYTFDPSVFGRVPGITVRTP